MSTDARTAMLSSIASSNAKAFKGRAFPSPEDDWQSIPRAYNASSKDNRETVLALFVERLEDYNVTVYHAKPDTFRDQAINVLRTREKKILLAPHSLALNTAGFVASPLNGTLTPIEIEEMQGVVTFSTRGIAETGTVILCRNDLEGRRVESLVPDYHLCLVRTSDVVATVPEAIGYLQANFASVPTTFVSGPSATADIEMTRIKGVHGPRTLDVILIHD